VLALLVAPKDTWAAGMPLALVELA